MSKSKQVLKQLRKALQEQREYESSLKIASDERLGWLLEKLLPFVPPLMDRLAELLNSKAPSGASPEISSSAAHADQVIQIANKLVDSLTKEQALDIHGLLSIEQKICLMELLRILRSKASSSSV